jgi:RNA polymerase sigma-70 factor (ECF subfamily)
VGNEFEAMSQYLAYCLNDTAPSAEHGAYIREMNLAIRACKDALSPEMQRVFTSAFENEMSHTVTAETENCPVATIRTRLHAAKKLMVSCMQRKGFEVSGSLTRGLP